MQSLFSCGVREGIQALGAIWAKRSFVPVIILPPAVLGGVAFWVVDGPQLQAGVALILAAWIAWCVMRLHLLGGGFVFRVRPAKLGAPSRSYWQHCLHFMTMYVGIAVALFILVRGLVWILQTYVGSGSVDGELGNPGLGDFLLIPLLFASVLTWPLAAMALPPIVLRNRLAWRGVLRASKGRRLTLYVAILVSVMLVCIAVVLPLAVLQLIVDTVWVSNGGAVAELVSVLTPILVICVYAYVPPVVLVRLYVASQSDADGP